MSNLNNSDKSSSTRRASSLLLVSVLLLSLIGITTSILTTTTTATATMGGLAQKQEARLFLLPSNRPFSKTLNLLNFMISGQKNKVSPLYLINGTICRYINNAPICTVLATTGLQTGQQASSSGAARPAGGGGQSGGGSSGGSVGSGSGGGGGSSGGSGGGGSSGGPGGGGGGQAGAGGANQAGGGNRPQTAGQLSSSSVQYQLGRPLAEDSLDLQAGASRPLQASANVGLLVRRRHLGLFGPRRPPATALLPQQPTDLQQQRQEHKENI